MPEATTEQSSNNNQEKVTLQQGAVTPAVTQETVIPISTAQPTDANQQPLIPLSDGKIADLGAFDKLITDGGVVFKEESVIEKNKRFKAEKEAADALKGETTENVEGEKKVEEKSGTDEEKTQEVLDEATKAVVEDTTQQQTTDKTNKSVNARDVSDLPQHLQSSFKRMSNDAFNTIKPVLLKAIQETEVLKKENNELKQGIAKIPQNYYENPDAVKLLPEYKQVTEEVNLVRSIKSHWKQQILNIQNGEDFTDLVTNEKGQIVQAPPRKGTVADTEDARERLMTANNVLQQKEVELQTMQHGFKAKHTEASGVIDGIMKQYFPMYLDEKSPAKPTIEKIKSMLQSILPTDKVRELLAFAFTGLITLKEQNEKLVADGKKKQTLEATVKSAGPTEGSISGGNGAVQKNKIASIDEFDKILSGR